MGRRSATAGVSVLGPSKTVVFTKFTAQTIEAGSGAAVGTAVGMAVGSAVAAAAGAAEGEASGVAEGTGVAGCATTGLTRSITPATASSVGRRAVGNLKARRRMATGNSRGEQLGAFPPSY